jgi:hypothetical protein
MIPIILKGSMPSQSGLKMNMVHLFLKIP